VVLRVDYCHLILVSNKEPNQMQDISFSTWHKKLSKDIEYISSWNQKNITFFYGVESH